MRGILRGAVSHAARYPTRHGCPHVHTGILHGGACGTGACVGRGHVWDSRTRAAGARLQDQAAATKEELSEMRARLKLQVRFSQDRHCCRLRRFRAA